MAYTGLEDFSGEIPSQEAKKADHRLVIIMWVNLANNFTQPVAYKVNLVNSMNLVIFNWIEIFTLQNDNI